MTITPHELARRLRAVRESCGVTREYVARHLEVSPPAVERIESGDRAVSSFELDRLAYLYGRNVRGFLAEPFEEKNAATALFRHHSGASEDEALLRALRKCLALGRELANLERLLGLERPAANVVAYPLPAPGSKPEAIRQGEDTANEERRRLGLGQAPLPELIEFLQVLGIGTAQVDLPDTISGLTLNEPETGILVVSNRAHALLRRRFSCAHEYGHVVMDLDRKGVVSRSDDRDDLIEVRANAFAACFLAPEEGVRQFIGRAVQMYDLVQLAHYFGMSRQAALHRLWNLRLLDPGERSTLEAQEREGLGRRMTKWLGLPESDPGWERDRFRNRFLFLAREAFRRGDVSCGKLREAAALIGVEPPELEQVLDEAGLDEPKPASVALAE